MKPTLTISSSLIRIYFNGLIHLCLKQKGLLGYQSYKDSENSYFIEYYYYNGFVVITEYNTVDKWKSVLKLLDKGLIKIL